MQFDWGQEWDKEKEYLPILFEPPIEAWPETVAGYERNSLADKYPLTLFQEHTKWRSHSAFGHNQWIRELDPEPRVYLHPVDAEQRGIVTGDAVRVFNDHGSVILRGRINPGVRKGSINIPKGWQTGQFIEGHYQRLTHRKHNPVCENSVFYDILIDVEKVEE